MEKYHGHPTWFILASIDAGLTRSPLPEQLDPKDLNAYQPCFPTGYLPVSLAAQA
jgi:hypothetical protein